MNFCTNHLSTIESILWISFERRERSLRDWFQEGVFIACAYKSEDDKGDICELSESVDMRLILGKMSDTADSMYSGKIRYKDFNENELLKIQRS